jgi:hypothetical protein
VVRLNTGAFSLTDEQGQGLDLVKLVARLKVGQLWEWPVWFEHAGQRHPLRLCVLCKSKVATQQAQRKAEENAHDKGQQVRTETLRLYCRCRSACDTCCAAGAASRRHCRKIIRAECANYSDSKSSCPVRLMLMGFWPLCHGHCRHPRRCEPQRLVQPQPARRWGRTVGFLPLGTSQLASAGTILHPL